MDGTQVLFLKGSPEAMGHQHVVLMKRNVRDLVKRVLYGVGVGCSFSKGRWFFGEMGGRGEGNWEGKPMAQLVREVMEKSDTPPGLSGE